jgi:hypothetical protein
MCVRAVSRTVHWCSTGRLEHSRPASTVEDLYGAFEEAGVEALRWYGVRVFTDHLGEALPDEVLPEVLELEWEAGRREPYRSVARLIHLLGRKKPIQRYLSGREVTDPLAQFIDEAAYQARKLCLQECTEMVHSVITIHLTRLRRSTRSSTERDTLDGTSQDD